MIGVVAPTDTTYPSAECGVTSRVLVNETDYRETILRVWACTSTTEVEYPRVLAWPRRPRCEAGHRLGQALRENVR
jgi:hypothetical protein